MMQRFTSRRGRNAARMGLTVIALGMAGFAGGQPVAAQAPQGDLVLAIDQRTESPIVTNATAKYDIEVSNPTLAGVTGVAVQINLPPQLSMITASPQTGSGFTCSVSGGTVGCTGGSAPAGVTREIRVEARTPATLASDSLTLTITAQVDPFNTVREANENNNTALATTIVETRPDLDPDLSSVPLSVREGLEITYPVIVRNAGNRVATGVVTRATLPAELSFVRVERGDFAACERAGRVITCAGAVIPAGSAGVLRVVASAPGTLGDASVLFEVHADPGNQIRERNETNNTAFALTTVTGRPDLVVGANSDGWSPAQVWKPWVIQQPVHGTTVFISVSNIGGGASPATIVRFQLDSALQEGPLCPGNFLNVDGSCVEGGENYTYPSCDASGGVVTCPVPSIPAGGSVSFQVEARRPYYGFGYDFSSTISVDPDRQITERSELNNSATFTVRVG